MDRAVEAAETLSGVNRVIIDKYTAAVRSSDLAAVAVPSTSTTPRGSMRHSTVLAGSASPSAPAPISSLTKASPWSLKNRFPTAFSISCDSSMVVLIGPPRKYWAMMLYKLGSVITACSAKSMFFRSVSSHLACPPT